MIKLTNGVGIDASGNTQAILEDSKVLEKVARLQTSIPLGIDLGSQVVFKEQLSLEYIAGECLKS